MHIILLYTIREYLLLHNNSLIEISLFRRSFFPFLLVVPDRLRVRIPRKGKRNNFFCVKRLSFVCYNEAESEFFQLIISVGVLALSRVAKHARHVKNNLSDDDAAYLVGWNHLDEMRN